MSNAKDFMDKFKVLENLLRDKFNIEDYNKSALKEVEDIPQFRTIKGDLRYIRQIRNLISHKTTINGEYPVEPHIKIVNKIQDIIDYINNPPKAYDKCVKINEVCYASKNEKIYPYMLAMKDNVFTHIPILEQGVVIGVFSENTLFGALIEDELVYEKEKTTFQNELINKYCCLTNHITETFSFIKKDLLLEDVKEMFLKSFKNKQRLAMLFITQNGKKDEKLLGILTPWDVLGK